MKIKDIKLNENNPRVIKDEKFKKLKKSIEQSPSFLKIRPIVLDENNMVLGGNMRLRACIDLGMKEVEVQIFTRDHADKNNIEREKLGDPTATYEEQCEEFIIKDNVGFGEWDWDMMANEWNADDLLDWGLDTPDIWNTEPEEAAEDNYEIPEDIKVDVVLGDLIEIGEHRLLCGDSTEVENWQKIMNDELCDLVITDPPYNVSYVGKTKDELTIKNDKQTNSQFYQFLYDFYTSLGSYTKKGGSWYVFHADSEGANFRQAMKDSGIMCKQCLIWVKQTMVMGRQDYQWKHEPILYGWKEGAAHNWYSDRKQTTVLEFDRPSRSAEHPTMKPINILEYQINNSSRKGDLISDGFLGSGSTMVAAHQLKRKCYGMELDPKYCQVIIDRMTKLDESLEIKINGKKYKPNIEKQM